jgi:hypothetical protein
MSCRACDFFSRYKNGIAPAIYIQHTCGRIPEYKVNNVSTNSPLGSGIAPIRDSTLPVNRDRIQDRNPKK